MIYMGGGGGGGGGGGITKALFINSFVMVC